MGQGYHSRSPEEFREYLKTIGKEKSKRKWRQIIILIDIFLLMFVAYLVFRSLNPGSFQDPTISTKQVVDGFPMYLSLSREPDEKYQGYFLFVENNSTKDIEVPNRNWTGEFRVLTKEGIVCFTEPIQWEPKKIPSSSKGFLYFSLSLNKLKNLEESCRTEIFDENYSFFRSKFRSLSLSFYSQILLTTATERKLFQIKQKPYRIQK